MYITFSISVFNCGLSIFNKRILLSLFKVTDFSANRKLICDFLLVNNITSYLTLFARYRSVLIKLSLLIAGASLCFRNLSNITISLMLLKTRFLRLHFCRRQYRSTFNHLYVIGPQNCQSWWKHAK